MPDLCGQQLWVRLDKLRLVQPDHPALSVRVGQNAWRRFTYRDLYEAAVRFGSFLIERGIAKGDRVALLSSARPEWALALFAILGAGAVVVPLDTKLGVDELTAIARDAEPVLILACDEFAQTAVAVGARLPTPAEVIVLADAPGDGLRSYAECVPRKVQAMRHHGEDELAVLTYTSGTTGEPKGVMTTMGNLIHQVDTTPCILEVDNQDRFVSILPLNHLLEMSGGLLAPLMHGAHVGYAGSLFPAEITAAMQEHGATRMVVVPLFLELVRRQIERKIAALPASKRAVFRLLRALTALLPAERFRRRVFRSVHRQFGGALRHFMVGGAPVDLETIRFYERLGIPILQGYGLTETSPVATFNTSVHNRSGSVGRALPGVELRIASVDDDTGAATGEGEVLIRGPNRMKGYYQRPELTHEVIDPEGWLRTGDRGRIDRDGYLFITGRIKNLIVLGSGKNVQPEEIEGRLQSPLFDEVCVLGARIAGSAEQVCAVVVPSELARSESDALTDDALEDAIRDLARGLATYKRPTRVFVSRSPLPKTATQKVKRREVLRWLAATQSEVIS